MASKLEQDHVADGASEDGLPDFGQPEYELPDYGDQPRPRKRGLRWGWFVGSLAVLLLILIVAAEFIARILVGSISATQIKESMPEGIVADVRVTPTGWCVLCELANGELSGLDINGTNVEFGGARGTIDLHAEGITLSDPVVLAGAEGSVQIGEPSLNRVLHETMQANGFTMRSIDLHDGSFEYRTDVEVFGAVLTIDVQASVRVLSGGRIQIIAEELSLQTGALGADIPIDADRFTLDVCIAEYLPETLEITSVEVVESALEVRYRTTESIELAEDTFQTRGSCTSG